MERFLLVSLVFLGIFPQDLLGGKPWACKDMTSTTPMMQLKQYLFCTYDQGIRQIENHTNATVIDFWLDIKDFTVDEITNSLDLYTMTRMVWIDSRLAWDPTRFGQIDKITVESTDIWIPDITLHSATNQYVEMSIPTVPCKLYHEGNLICVPMAVYTTICDSDHTWWPYDVMKCSIQLSSWSYTADEIYFAVDFWETEAQKQVDSNNTQWQIVSISITNQETKFKFDQNYSSDSFFYHIILKRHSTMYISYITFAVALMTMTLTVLWLEPSSNERMIIANLNFVLHLLCLHDLNWKVPFNGFHPPKLLILYENSLILATFSLILTSVLRQMQQTKVAAPAWISTISVSILNSRIGQILSISILDPNVSAKMELNADDNTNLVTIAPKDYTWKYTSILIGWFAFFSILFVYAMMLGLLLPTSTSSNSYIRNS